VDRVDCVVIGAGVVGLAVARGLARAGLETLIVEQYPQFGTGTSARNSEVIHAGMYYPAGSLKARLCVRGRALLYEYCRRHNIAHRRCGKLIVAGAAIQHPRLEQLLHCGQRNGVNDLCMLEHREAIALEPALYCTAALLSPSTGILDAHGYMLSLLGDAESHGAALAVKTRVSGLRPVSGGIDVYIDEAAQPALKAGWIVNSAGLEAPRLARSIEDFPTTAHVPCGRYAKGSYFALSGSSPFARLIYPLPEPGGLGIHLTLDLAGRARFGPDVEWVDTLDYRVDPARGERFYAAIRSYWPQLRDGALMPAYAGIRPKISGPDEPAADFRIEGPEVHGVPGIVNLFGIESPGLTASLAIAEYVAALITEKQVLGDQGYTDPEPPDPEPVAGAL
jgi:L-2-hydroxyglutarate oxidase LhgO